MAEEVMMVKPDEFNSLVQYYKGQMSGSALLNKAGRVAAEAHVLLRDSDVPDGIANVRVKELLRHRRVLSKRLREIPGVAPPGGGAAPPLEEEEGVLTAGTTENLLKQIVKSIKQQPAVKIEKVTPGEVKKEKATPSTSRLGTLLRKWEAAGAKPKKPTGTPREELLESVRKSRERLAKAREDLDRAGGIQKKETKRKTEAGKLQPLPGWEDWAQRRKLRRQLDYDETDEEDED